MKAYRAYLFDMDGTLVDNTDDHVTAWQVFSRRYGNELTDAQVRGWMGRKGAYYFEQIVRRPLAPEEVARMNAEMSQVYRETVHPVLPDGLRDFLEDAKRRGILCAVATGAPRANLDFNLDALGIRDFFAALVDNTMYAASKPAPDCYLKAAELLGVAPADCLVFEDAVSGIASARAAGAATLAVTFTTTRQALAAAGADRIVDSYRELLA